MKIDIAKLQKVITNPDGSVVAQCPACAAVGGDTTGNHLIVYADGKYGCVVHKGDKDHNKEIFKLVGLADGKPADRAKVKIRPYRVPCTKVIAPVPRKTWEELGFVRDLNRPVRILR